jgi:hypothetical protein
MAVTRECACGHETASMHHLNSVLPEEAVVAVYCPGCKVEFDQATMITDNGWTIEYDMELVSAVLPRYGVDADTITPALVFDQGYASWNGLTPTDVYDKAMEFNDVVNSTKGDKPAYFAAVRAWTLERTARLAADGWRKAKLAL